MFRLAMERLAKDDEGGLTVAQAAAADQAYAQAGGEAVQGAAAKGTVAAWLYGEGLLCSSAALLGCHAMQGRHRQAAWLRLLPVDMHGNGVQRAVDAGRVIPMQAQTPASLIGSRHWLPLGTSPHRIPPPTPVGVFFFHVHVPAALFWPLAPSCRPEPGRLGR